MRRALLSFALLWVVLLRGDGAAELVNKRGKIEGESFVNLRSGPDLGYPSRAVLKKGEELTVEKEEGSWYFVSLADGRKGYIHKSLIILFENGQTKTAVKNEVFQLSVQVAPVSSPSEEEKSDLPFPTPPPAAREASRGKPLPIIQVLEGKEMEILWWFGAVLCVFIIGWICGGNYYLRRDRIRRKKLHF